MTRLVLHVGQPKTGTTALQSVLSENAPQLLAQGSVLYPTRTSPSEHKHAFAIPWLLGIDNEAIQRRARVCGDELRRLSQAYWQSLLAEVNQVGPEVLVLSAEGFWFLHQASQEDVTLFQQALYAIVQNITVAGYLKSPAAYFLSMINQKLRNYHPVQMPRPDFYSATMLAWESAGFDSCSWRVFERGTLINGDIVDDFCGQYLPGSVRVAELQRQGVERANASVSNEALVILEHLAIRYPVLASDLYDRRRHQIVAMLRQADSAVGGHCRPRLSEGAAVLLTRHCQDLSWLRDRGICFEDVDNALIDHVSLHQASPYSQVADYCPVDPERLHALRALVMTPIEHLFRAAPRAASAKRWFWPFRGRLKR
jgi:hypothetical protein